MFQLPFSSFFNIRRFAIRFNEFFAVRDEFSMKDEEGVGGCFFPRLRSDDGSAEPVRTHPSITLVRGNVREEMHGDTPFFGWVVVFGFPM